MASNTPPQIARQIAEWLSQAKRQLQQGDMGGAKASLESVLGLAPAHPYAMHYLGLLRHQQGQHDEAHRLLREAYRGVRHDPVACFNFATVLLQQARYAEAVEPLQQALSLRPDYDDAKLRLGVVSFKLGDLNQAATAFRSVLEGRPDHFFALTNLAATLLQLDSEQAIMAARHAVQVAPDGQRARPLRILTKALALSSALMEPENGDAHYTERLERLPNFSFCYGRDRILGQRGEADLRHLRRQRIVYLCTQSLGSFYRSTISYSRASWRPFPTANCGSLRAQPPRSPNDSASACWPSARTRASARSASSFTIA